MDVCDPLGWLGHIIDGRFAVQNVVGEGGFGIVYRARHLGFDEPVAIKFLHFAAPLSAEQREVVLADFRGEARLLHRLSRKTAGIVQALDVGAATSPAGAWTPYIVMEWLEGSTLAEDIQRRARQGEARRTIGEAVGLLASAAEALAIAHAERVAHLDVKPANLFVCCDRARTVKVLDFGIAKVLSASKTLTRALAGRGKNAFTPAYAAPEQFDERHGAIGPQTDVFAFALVLLELCAGRPALAGETPMQLYFSAANEFVRPTFAAAGVSVDSGVEAVLRSALEVDAARRFPDLGSMWEALSLAVDTAQAPATVREPLSTQSGGAGPATAPTVAHTLPVTTGQNRLCTVLMVELTGTEELARLDPGQLSSIVDRCFSSLKSQVQALGGTVDELAGETLVALFGALGETSNAAERAVHCALRMKRSIGELSLPQAALRARRFGLRIGIHTGRVFVGRHTEAGRLRIAGTPIKTASQLQRGAPADAIVISRETHRHVAGLFEVSPLSLGQARPAFVVNGLAERRHDLGTLVGLEFHGLETRFVGREAEMGALAAVIDAVLDERRSGVAFLRGRQGLGKSRMLVELGARLEREGFAVFAARASELGAHASYGLAASLLRGRLRIHDDDDAEVTRLKLERALAEREVDRDGPRRALRNEDVVAPLLRVLGLEEPVSSANAPADLSGTSVRHRIAAAFAELLHATGKPPALLCDDIHYCDEASAELLRDVVLRLGDEPLLVVGTASGGESWSLGRDRVVVEVEAMSRRHLERMARDRLRRVRELDAGVVEELARRAEGNPLALTELLSLLVDAEVIETGAEDWTMHPERIGEIGLPTTILEMAQARLDRLDVASRELLCHAAVIGRTFWSGALAAIAPELPLSAIDALERRGLVRRAASSSFPDEQEYAFADGPVLEVAYDSLATPLRRELHRRAAVWLEHHVAAEAGASLIAGHYEHAGALIDALEAHVRAGRRAAQLGRNEEARASLERACALEALLFAEEAPAVDDLPLYWEEAPCDPLSWPSTERVRLRFELAEVLRRMGALAEAERRYAEARALVTNRGSDSPGAEREWVRWRVRIDLGAASAAEVRGALEEPLAVLEGALACAAEADLHEEQALMLALVAAIRIRQGDMAAAGDACLEGLRVCRGIARRGARWREAVSRLLRTLGSVSLHRGHHVRAERHYLQASRLVDAERDPHLASSVLNNVAVARYLRGDLVGARESFMRVHELAERSGDLVVVMIALANTGEVALGLGEHERAREALEEAARLGEHIGALGDLADVCRNLAAARLAGGDRVGSEQAMLRALELASIPAGRRYLPQVLASAADLEEALGSEELSRSWREVAERERGSDDAGAAARSCLERERGASM